MMGQEKMIEKDSFRSIEHNSFVPYSSNSNIGPYGHNKLESITLNDWLKDYHTTEQLQNLFVNMDIAMKYIHDQGYYISSFALDRISLLNHSIRQVKFHDLNIFPLDISQQKQVVRDNVFMAAVLHMGIYANCLQYFTMNTIPSLKENFHQFKIFLPSEDIPYYSGIIERGASVYYSSYVGERKKRDLQNLENEVSTDSGDIRGKSLVKTNGNNYIAEDFLPNNEGTNELIYASLIKKEAAFVRALIYPVLVFILGLVILFLSCFLQ